ncbi:MAG: HTTM domain-containing protein [Rubrobacteraceae bacterium]
MPGRLFEAVDAASLAFFRVGFGLIMVWEVCRYFYYGWIGPFYIEPSFHFTYYGFGWVAPWPGIGMRVHFVALGVLAAFIALGLFYRLCMALFFVGFTYVFLLDQSWYLNHFYLVSLVSLLMIFAPAHRAFSLDALRRPEKVGTGVAPAWALWVMRFQISVVYFYGGLAKINGDWLRGEPMRAWISPFTDPFGEAFTHWAGYFFSYGGLLFDLSIVPLLLWRRTRVPAFILAVGFHVTNAGLFDIGIFPWFAIAATTLFFAPSWPRHAAREEETPEEGGAVSRLPGGSTRRRVVVALLAVFVAFQLLMPLRHFLYPGNPSWTEEGHRFAWRMKLRSVSAEATFYAADPESERAWRISPTSLVTASQAGRMAPYPDMVLQLSHEIADRFRERGYEEIEVRAVVYATLNGREPQLLIDPKADLAAQPRSLAPAAWIPPLKEPLPATGEPGKTAPSNRD